MAECKDCKYCNKEAFYSGKWYCNNPELSVGKSVTIENCFTKRIQTNADRIKAMSEEELADFLLGFSKEDIIEDWCSNLCPHRMKEPPRKCEIDLEKNACPCDTKDIVTHWLKKEVKEERADE